MAYTFYLDKLKLPVTPESLEIKIKNKNKTVDLINEGEINLLKTPGLSEVSFSFLLPQNNYHFADDLQSVEVYMDKLENLKTEQKSFQFIVYREAYGKVLFETNMKVSLEDYTISESADDNTDLRVSVNLKQYRDWGTKTIKVKRKSGASTKKATKKSTSTKSKKSSSSTYTVKKGDCLWNIAKRFYGSGTQWKKIYNANKSVIEKTARKYGRKSSSNGHYIYPNMKLTIPK